MKNQILITAVTASLALSNIASELKSVFDLAEDLSPKYDVNYLTPSIANADEVFVTNGFPQLNEEDIELGLKIYKAGYVHYNFIPVAIVVIATDRTSAEFKANKLKKSLDDYVVSKFPQNGLGKLHVTEEPLSNPEALSLASQSDLLYTIC